MKKSLPEIAKYLKHCQYDCEYDEKDELILGGFFTIFKEKEKFGLDFSVDAYPDVVSILSQRLSGRFGKFEVYESWYYYRRDDELCYGEEAMNSFMLDISEKAMNEVFGEFRMMTSSQNLYTPSFQSQTEPWKMIKVMLSDRWKEEDAIKCKRFFEDKGCKILIVWDYELKEENRKQLMERIKSFIGTEEAGALNITNASGVINVVGQA